MKNDDNTKLKEEQKDQVREVEEENKEKKALEESLKEWEAKFKRALADYQNLEKRSKEERAHWIKLANRELLLQILPILDTLMLAGNHTKEPAITVCVQQFFDILKKEGLEKIKTNEVEFNPHTMECVATEKGEDGKVLEELRAGFMLGEQVLRPAQVKVGRKQ